LNNSETLLLVEVVPVASIIGHQYVVPVKKRLHLPRLQPQRDLVKSSSLEMEGSKVHPLSDSEKDLHDNRDILRKASIANRGDGPCRIVLNPDHMSWQLWDLYLAVLLLYVAVVTPFEVAFLETVMWSALFWINRLVDVSFIFDMGRQFFVPYADAKQDGKIIRDNSLMAKHYLWTWFPIDFVSIIPYDVATDSLGLPDTLKFIKIVRLLRVFKLLRVVKSMRILSKYESKSTMSYSTKQLLSFFVMIIFLAHWGACAWHLSSTLVTAEVDNWVWNYGIQGESAETKYCTAFYWATMSITTIGYGDVVATTSTEQMFAILFMLIGGGVYAYVVGGICGIFASLNQELNDFHTAVDNLNSYMREMNCPPELAADLRNYFLNCKDMHKEKYNREVMDMMSPGLRKKFIFECFNDCIKGISFIDVNELSDPLICFEFLSQLVLALRPAYYPPNEQVIRENEMAENMYIIKKGLVGFRGSVLRKNQSFGDDVICGTKRDYWATTLTFTVLLVLGKDDLLGVVQQGGFEKLANTIYTRAKWMRLKQALLMFKKTADVMKVLTMAGVRDIKYAWKDNERTYLSMEYHHEGEEKSWTVHRNHINLLVADMAIAHLMAPFHSKNGGAFDEHSAIARPRQNFTRHVPVAEMTENDLQQFLDAVMKSEMDKWLGDFVGDKILQKVEAGLERRKNMQQLALPTISGPSSKSMNN